MNKQILLDFIKKEQAENLPLANKHAAKAKSNSEYYSGYYNGYLTALANLQILLVNNGGK